MAKFTPDIELELLFPSHLIPQRVKDELPDDLHVRSLRIISQELTDDPMSPHIFLSFTPNHVQMRPLASTDYHRGHLDILAVLTHTPDPGAQAWLSQFQSISHAAYTYYSIVIVSKTTDRIVAVGTVFLERKFLRGLGLVGHIEDIAVDKSQQGKKLGLRVIQALTGISEGRGCYKTILNCNESNIREFNHSIFVEGRLGKLTGLVQHSTRSVVSRGRRSRW